MGESPGAAGDRREGKGGEWEREGQREGEGVQRLRALAWIYKQEMRVRGWATVQKSSPKEWARGKGNKGRARSTGVDD